MAQPNYFDQFDNTPSPFSSPTVTTLPQSPQQRAEEERKRRDQAIAEQKAAQEKAEHELRVREWNATHNPDGSPKAQPGGMTTDQRQAAKQDATLDSIVGQVNRVQELYQRGIRDETFWNGFGALDAIGPSAGRFDSAGQGLADQGLAAFRVPGVGSQSDLEAAQFAAANTPQSGDWDQRIEEKLSNIRRRVDANRKALGLPPAQWTGMGDSRDQPPAGIAPAGGSTGGGTPPPAPGTYGSANPTPPVFSPGGPQYDPSQNTRTVSDQRMEAIGAEYRKRLASGQNSQEIIRWLSGQNVSPQTIMQAIEQLKYREQNPEVPADRYSITTTSEVPLSAYERAATTAGNFELPGGFSPGAYTLGAADFLTGSNLDSLSSDPERTRLSQQVMATRNPGSTFTGQMSGGIMGSLAGEAALARLGMAPGFLRGLAADVSMGSANGAGMADDGNRLLGAAQGGLAAGVGSGLGAGATKLAGRALSPSGGELRPLYDAGVRPTPGQRFANSGTMGRILNTTEEALQSVPIVGQAIRGARQEARDQFQVGAFNEALGEIGEQLPKGMKPGTDPHTFAQTAFNRVYDQARSSMRMVADEQLSNELGQLAPDISTLGPAAQRKLKAIMANTVNNRAANGEMSGGAYKKAMADLGRHTSRLRNSPMAEDQALADVLDGVRGALDSSARRHSDPAAVQLLDAADAGYAKLVRIEEAAARRGGGAGVFSPANFDSAVQRSAGGVRSKAYSRGDALMQDYANAGRSLDDTLPNSGTADRVMAGYAVGTPIASGAVYLDPRVAALLGTVATAYAPGVRRMTKGALAPPGPTRKAIARQLEKRARLLGITGAGAAAASLQGTTPGR